MHMRHEGNRLAYMTRTFVHEPAYLVPVRSAGEHRRAGMQLSPYEGALLAWIVAISGAVRILELGTFMGYSALWMASKLPDHGHITSLEISTAYAQQARAHVAASPHAARITIVETMASAWLAAQPPTPQYDLVFIDADKKHYAEYLTACLPLLRPRGWVVGDNTLLFGAVSGDAPDAASVPAQEAMRTFNTILADPAQFESMLLPTAEGLTVARRR